MPERVLVIAAHPDDELLGCGGTVALHTRAGDLVTAVVVCGLATNICCFYAARDLRRAGFRVLLVEDASAGLDVPAAGLFQTAAREEGLGMGIEYVLSAELLPALRP